MSHNRRLNDNEISQIMSQYQIGSVLKIKILSGGSENTNYLISTDKNAFVLTICEQKSLENTINLGKLLTYLNSNGFNTSQVVKTRSGGLVAMWNHKNVMLKNFIDGDIVENLSDNLLIKLGNELANLHKIKAPSYLPKTIGYGIELFDQIQYQDADPSFYDWLLDTKEYIQQHMKADLPKALIHSDVFFNNVIVNQERNKTTIMDFEEACYSHKIFDIGMTIVGTCCNKSNINITKVASLLKGYQQVSRLLNSEINSLKAFIVYAAAATGYWRYKNFNYINIIAEMKNHFLEMKVLAENIMNLPDDCFKRICNSN